MSVNSRTVSPILQAVSDEKLALQARDSRPAMDEMIRRYYGFVRLKAQSYFLVSGGDNSDLIQEGLLGLFKAIRDFNPDGGASFRNFAEMCISRQIITAVKTATRKKHETLNQAIDLYSPPPGHKTQGGKETSLIDAMATPEYQSDPMLAIRRKEMADTYRQLLLKLSSFEAGCLAGLLSGMAYQEIGELLGCDAKSVDNALQRAKTKLRPLLIEFADVA